MWINFDQLLDLPNVTVVNYQKIAQTIFLKLALLNETIECPNCHQYFTKWCHSPDINSFRFASALNPDSSICMNCSDSPWFFTVSFLLLVKFFKACSSCSKSERLSNLFV